MNLLAFFKNADEVQEFTAGETVFSEGDHGDVMYVVLDGELEVLTKGRLVEVSKPGDIIGEMALIDSRTRSATVVARTNCRLAPVNEKRFLFMVQQTPFFALHVMKILADRLRRMNG